MPKPEPEPKPKPRTLTLIPTLTPSLTLLWQAFLPCLIVLAGTLLLKFGLTTLDEPSLVLSQGLYARGTKLPYFMMNASNPVAANLMKPDYLTQIRPGLTGDDARATTYISTTNPFDCWDMQTTANTQFSTLSYTTNDQKICEGSPWSPSDGVKPWVYNSTIEV